MLTCRSSVQWRDVRIWITGVAGLSLLSGCLGPPKVVTTESLLKEMTDLRGLSEYPDPPFTCRQFSSYDRASVSADDSEKWFANADAGQFIREEKVGDRTEYVMADMDGPGAIVRIWSANPKGTLRIYLDGSEAPEIECPMADFLGGKLPWNPSPIACEVSRGWNSYFPIPYAKHCKMTCDAKEFYYHVNYRTYPRSTRVTSFDMDTTSALNREVEGVVNGLNEPLQFAESLATARQMGGDLNRRGRQLDSTVRTMPFDTALGAGERATLLELTGPREIQEIVLRTAGMHDATQLRQSVLTIEFDGRPCVEAPVGDLFGAAPGLNTYPSLPLGIAPDGSLWARWSMPFRRNATMTLANGSSSNLSVSGYVRSRPVEFNRHTMYFHAKTRIQNGVPTRPMIDWNYLTARGKGQFVGVAFNIANPVREWWGEGDEKIYVDGEKFPSHFGTGTEDYYGYAWCCNQPFQHPYHNQPRCDGPHNYGYTAVNRWHILDRIPFRKNFKFDMELWHWNPDTRVDMAVTAYWYARPGATDDFPPLDPAELKVAVIPPYVPPRVPGAIEGETLRIVQKSGVAEPQTVWDCSNESHLWWHEGHQPGDKLVLAFDAPSAGTYDVAGRFLKAVDYGVHQLYVNDARVAEPLDFYNNGVTVTGEIGLGRFDLKEGENQFIVEVVGANDQALKKYMFGLDYLRLQPVAQEHSEAGSVER